MTPTLDSESDARRREREGAEAEAAADGLAELSTVELKERLRALGLSTGGNKAKLVERLAAA